MKKTYILYSILSLLYITSCKTKEPAPATGSTNNGGGGGSGQSEQLHIATDGWEHVLDMYAPNGHEWGERGSYYIKSKGLHRVDNQVRLYADGLRYTIQDPIMASCLVNSPGSNFSQKIGILPGTNILCFDDQPDVYGVEITEYTINSVIRQDLYVYDTAGTRLRHQIAYNIKFVQGLAGGLNGGLLLQSDLFNLSIMNLKTNQDKAANYTHNMNYDKCWAMCNIDNVVYAPYVDRFGKLVMARLRDEKDFGNSDSIVSNSRYYFSPIADYKNATNENEVAKNLTMSATKLANGKISIVIVAKNRFISQYFYDAVSNKITPSYEKLPFVHNILTLFTLNTGRIITAASTDYNENVYTIQNGISLPINQGFHQPHVPVEQFFVSDNYLYATIVKQGVDFKEPKLTLVRKKW